MIRAALIAMLMGLAAGTPPAAAHRVHEAVTEIRFNARTREVEIAHRLFAHDLEFALVEAGLPDTAAPSDADWQAAARAHLAASFGLAIDGERVEPGFVGLEFEGRFAWAYFTVPQADPYREIGVENRILMGHFDDQSNLTNIFFGDIVRTVSQTARSAGWQSVSR